MYIHATPSPNKSFVDLSFGEISFEYVSPHIAKISLHLSLFSKLEAIPTEYTKPEQAKFISNAIIFSLKIEFTMNN